MESRDHTGNLAGGLALAALGYQFTEPLEGMALAVGDFAMLAVRPTEPTAQPTVGDPPQPLTNWLPDDTVAVGGALSDEPTTDGGAGTHDLNPDQFETGSFRSGLGG